MPATQLASVPNSRKLRLGASSAMKMAKVAPAISKMVNARTRCLPIRSPNCE